MAKNITCPKCGAPMQRESYPERYVCEYCDTIIYPEKRETPSPTTQLPPPPQHIYIHTQESATPKKEEKIEKPWYVEDEVEDEPDYDGTNSGCLALVIGIIILLIILTLAFGI